MMAAARIVDLVSNEDDKRYEPAGRMASAIIAVSKEKGGCLPQDLNERGFTPEEVAKHWHMAKSLAEVELKLMNEKPARPQSRPRDHE
jgi:hypothetical protein